MLLVNVEGNLIENMIIINEELLFSENSLNNEAVYSPVPVNEYAFNTDTYKTVNLYLYDEEYLGFIDPMNQFLFTDECIIKHSEGQDNFIYNGLQVSLEEIEDIEIQRKFD